jgi:hypothetical protein
VPGSRASSGMTECSASSGSMSGGVRAIDDGQLSCISGPAGQTMYMLLL